MAMFLRRLASAAPAASQQSAWALAPAMRARFFSSRNSAGSIFYTKDHEYVRVEAPGVAVVGISNFAQEALGEIVYVDLPKVGAAATAGKPFTSIESVKSANDVYSPVTGTISEVNSALEEKVQTINESAETEGWMVKVKMSNPADLDKHMDAAAYKKFCAEAH